MATRKVGAQVELSGEKQYKQAISELNAANKTMRAEMSRLQTEYAENAKSSEFLTQKSQLLGDMLLRQQEKVKTLQAAVAHAAEEYGESSTRTQGYAASLAKAQEEEIKLQRALNEANAELEEATAREGDYGNAVDEATNAMEAQGQEMQGLGNVVDDLSGKFGIRLPEGAKNALNGMKSFSAGTVAAMAASAAAVAAVIKIVKELGEMTLKVAADVDTYITESMITGVSTEMLQAWDYAAPLIDVDAETIKGAMTKLTRAMAEVKSGNENTIASFEGLGVSVTDASGNLRDADEVFGEVIDALGNVENQTERDALAMELMGKSAQDLNPLIIQGSEALDELAEEAKKAGYVLDEEQIKKLGEVDDAYQRLQLTIEANRKQLAAQFAPAAKEAMELFSSVVSKAGKALIDSGILENLVSVVTSLMSIIKSIGDILSEMPGFSQALEQVKNVMTGVAVVAATLADAMQIIAGLMTLDFGRIKQGLGLDAKNGNYSNLQRLNGTASTMDAMRNGYRGNGGADMSGYGYDSATGMYYDLQTGNYIFHNAGGTDSWRGGLTWVGEAGPELVSLPKGSQILNAQESAQVVGGDSYYFNINVDDLQDLQGLIAWAKTARTTARTR